MTVQTSYLIWIKIPQFHFQVAAISENIQPIILWPSNEFNKYSRLSNLLQRSSSDDKSILANVNLNDSNSISCRKVE